MTHPSPTDLLALHAVRLTGFADSPTVAARFRLDPDRTHEDLLDAQAYGWVSRSSFADLAGWSLTTAGRRRNEAHLRDELDRVNAHDAVARAHEHFVTLNARAAQVFTAWQLRPDEATTTLHDLAELAEGLHDLDRSLTACLARFAGYHDRFTRALARAGDDREWITGVDVDSCHRIWFELHEDLIATLGLTR
ncbi:transcriptional regulator [Micromonospora sp. HM134]|uniref:transcriptional regulator n=1 Tax=Micromonospora sp. HM134 TaxID=2583243 RepID=UPI001198368B|nr:transcriptional regulator [Micromonospora sp. HM134]QDY09365.1 transcriptional regulator [Micromonospora sp. HM134]